MAFRDSLSDIYHWWCTELSGIWPLRSSSGKTTPVSAILTIRRDGILITPADRSSKVAPVLLTDAREAVDHLRQKYFRIRIARPGVAIAIDEDRYLRRQLSPLRLPRSKMAAMARLDMQASTPFSLLDAYMLCGDSSKKDAASGYAVIKKTILKPLLDELAAAGIAVRTLKFLGGDGAFRPDLKSIQGLQPVSKMRILGGRLQTAAGAVFVLGLAATIAHAHWRYYEAGNELDTAIAAAADEATLVRTMIAARNMKISQITAIRNEKRGAVPLVSVLEELSRVVPDTTWLTDIEISGDEVTFSGFSASAAALIPLLEESKMFRTPTFRSPVVRVANQIGERFTIGMEVEAADG